MAEAKWREHVYPDSVCRPREAHGSDRCQSRGRSRVSDLQSIVKDGLVCHPISQALVTTPPLQGSGVWIFAVKGGTLRLAPDGGRRPSPENKLPANALPDDAIKHETLYGNLPVSAAGEIAIKNGIIVDLNEFSGTYCATMDTHFKGAVLEALQRSGVKTSPQLRRKLK